MYLGAIILFLVAVVGLSLVPARLFAASGHMSVPPGRVTTAFLGAILAFLVTVLVATRSLGFGVDTVAYAELFGAHCMGYELKGYGASFLLSVALLNLAMLGACSVSMLPLAWVVIVVALIMLAPAPIARRLAYAGLFLFSLVGIELTTNALRQSFAVGLSVLAVALYPRSRFAALLLAAAAALAHNSAALVLLAAWGATFGWRLFLLGMASAIALVAASLLSGNAFFLLEPLLYEIEKYLGHEGDEIFVRLLAAASLLVVLGAPVLAAEGAAGRRRIWHSDRYQVALRLSLTCLPLLAVPWFGFRYIYGVWPIVLWLILAASEDWPDGSGRIFGWILAGNALILLGWSFGSSYMRTVPFYA